MEKFIIAGTGRSGSTYIAILLQRLGINCGHEKIFNQWGDDYNTMPDWDDSYDGDSSFVATPFFDRFDGVCFHQQRNKEDCIKAFKRNSVLKAIAAPYEKFIVTHLPEVLEQRTYPERLECYYEGWNRLGRENADLSYFIDELDVDTLQNMCNLIGYDLDVDRADKILNEVPTDINSTK